MAKIKLSDFEGLFPELRNDRILVGFSDDEMVFAFFRHNVTNSICLYHTYLSYSNVDEMPELMEKTYDIDKNDVKTYFIGYDMFYSILRKDIISRIKKNCTNGDKSPVFSMIQEKIIKDGGKIVSFHTKKGLLIGAASTDEDYYYIFIDEDYNILSTSCVGKYKVLEESETTDSLRKLKCLSGEDKEDVLRKMIYHFMLTPEVFFTEIHIPNISEDELRLFNYLSLCYVEEK